MPEGKHAGGPRHLATKVASKAVPEVAVAEKAASTVQKHQEKKTGSTIKYEGVKRKHPGTTKIKYQGVKANYVRMTTVQYIIGSLILLSLPMVSKTKPSTKQWILRWVALSLAFIVLAGTSNSKRIGKISVRFGWLVILALALEVQKDFGYFTGITQMIAGAHNAKSSSNPSTVTQSDVISAEKNREALFPYTTTDTTVGGSPPVVSA